MAIQMGQKTNDKPQKLIIQQNTYSAETKMCLSKTQVHMYTQTHIPQCLFQLFEACFCVLVITVYVYA